MGILSRYVIKEILRIQVPLWLGLGFFIFLLEWMGSAFAGKGDVWTVLKIYIYKLPAHLQLVFPISVLFAFLLVFGHMSKSRETVAAQSFGYTRRKIFVPAFFAMVLSSIPFYFVMNFLAPMGMKQHLDLYDTYVRGKPSGRSQVQKEKIWYRNQDVLYTISYFKPESAELLGVSMYTFDEDFHIAQSVYAEKAVWEKDHWVLLGGKVYVADKRLRSPVVETFERRETRLIEAPSELKRVDWSPETLTQTQLWRAIEHSKALGINTSRWETSYHARWSFFAVAFVFILLAFPRVTRFHRSGGAAKDGVFVAAVCLSFWVFFNFGINLGNAGRLPPVVAAWLPTLLFTVGVYIYNRTLTLKTTSE